MLAWYENPSYFDTEVQSATDVIFDASINQTYADTVIRPECEAQWTTCQHDTLSDYYGSETNCVLALLAGGFQPTYTGGIRISHSQYCNFEVWAYFRTVPVGGTVRSFSGVLLSAARFVEIAENTNNA